MKLSMVLASGFILVMALLLTSPSTLKRKHPNLGDHDSSSNSIFVFFLLNFIVLAIVLASFKPIVHEAGRSFPSFNEDATDACDDDEEGGEDVLDRGDGDSDGYNEDYTNDEDDEDDSQNKNEDDDNSSCSDKQIGCDDTSDEDYGDFDNGGSDGYEEDDEADDSENDEGDNDSGSEEVIQCRDDEDGNGNEDGDDNLEQRSEDFIARIIKGWWEERLRDYLGP